MWIINSHAGRMSGATLQEPIRNVGGAQTMNIAELEALRAVAETGSFTRAADRLGMSQPGLSRQIQRLERELGTRLLERRGTGAILTDAGRESMQFAIRTISDFDALVSRFGPDPSALTGVIRIVAAQHLPNTSFQLLSLSSHASTQGSPLKFP